MKRLILLFLLLPVVLGAQRSTSLEVFGAYGFSKESNSFLKELGLDGNYVPVTVGRFGFGASFKLNQRSYLRSSLQFSTYGIRYVSENLRWGTQGDGMGGFDISPSNPVPATRSELNLRYLYTEAVLAYVYQFKTHRKWQPFLEGGIAGGKYWTSKFRNESSGGTNGASVESGYNKNPRHRSFSFAGRLGAGSNYQLSKKVSLYGMAVYQRHLLSINNELGGGTARVHPWQATLEAGVRFHLE